MLYQGKYLSLSVYKNISLISINWVEKYLTKKKEKFFPGIGDTMNCHAQGNISVN